MKISWKIYEHLLSNNGLVMDKIYGKLWFFHGSLGVLLALGNTFMDRYHWKDFFEGPTASALVVL
jgi:hypothetical protein